MDNTRRTGRSTKQAFQLLARAIGEPNTWVQVLDHAGLDHPKADRALCNMIFDIGMKMDLNLEMDIENRRFKSLHTGLRTNENGELEIIPLPKERG